MGRIVPKPPPVKLVNNECEECAYYSNRSCAPRMRVLGKKRPKFDYCFVPVGLMGVGEERREL